MHKILLTIISIFFAYALYVQQTDTVFLFSYFNNNGKDGLHLVYSNDEYNWTALNNDRSLLLPVLSKDSLMRDPCIIRGADNLFHMVSTGRWNGRGIGYAHYKDLIYCG